MKRFQKGGSIVERIVKLIENNRGRPIPPQVLFDHFSESADEVRSAVWEAVDNGLLEFTSDWCIALPMGGGQSNR